MTRETDSKTSALTSRLARLDAAQVQAAQVVLAVLVLSVSSAVGHSGLFNAHFAMIGQIFGGLWLALAAMQLVQAVQKDATKETEAEDA
ncbi:hypothetical protein [Celeribacter sp. PS-C1]|uniref:hypothetical protein n=1 Tax=Celeribacter sp. PS-C1 TaxID=2820813 RepID=UPI001CA598DE|nr:hypothetical protein [Celeribacter sp. PS-C1]MBW6418997.1 hypothetical protein [Celeribacter sp. PS-C1]